MSENTNEEKVNEVEEITTEEQPEVKEKKTSKRKTKKQDEEIAKLLEEVQTQKESTLRLMAEYDNYRKRTSQEKLNIYADATAKAISNLLPVADSMDMAVAQTQDAPEEFKKGLELVAQQLKQTFEKMNIECFGAVGDEFNPEMHNAISKIDDEELGENTLSQVFQKGYKLEDKIIRHAMVQVANCD